MLYWSFLYCKCEDKVRKYDYVNYWNCVCLYQLDEAERFWFAFVLYSIKRLSEKNGDSEQQGSDDNGFTLCQILRAAKLKCVYDHASLLFCFCFCFGSSSYFVFHSIVDFFKELPQFVVKAGPILSNLYGADWENRLEVLV